MKLKKVKKYKKDISGNALGSMIDKSVYYGDWNEEDLKDFFKLLEKKANEVNRK